MDTTADLSHSPPPPHGAASDRAIPDLPAAGLNGPDWHHGGVALQAAASAANEHGFQLHLQGRLSQAEPYYRQAVALDPYFPEAWTNLGLCALAGKRVDQALACQRQALLLAPDSADVHNNLGMAHYTKGHIAEAENAFRAALRLKPAHPNAMLNLGSARQLQHHPAEAEALFRRALELGADPARGRGNLALSLLEQVRPEAAEAECRAALAVAEVPEVHANLALALLMQGKLEQGWREYEARWQVEAGVGPLPNMLVPQWAVPQWGGQALHGKTVLLWAEQGFGDTLQFCRYAPMVAAAGGLVVLAVPRALKRIMATLDGVANVVCEDDTGLPHFDYHCPLLSLPAAFGTTLETIPACVPYLRADPAPWRDALDALPGLKVGLVWAGKSRTEQPHAAAIDRRRSMRFRDMAPLLGVAGCDFVSLQLGPAAAQRPAAGLLDVSERIADWSDTARLIAGLDLVISVDTAAAHLAGALGKPVWLLSRFDACWRWLTGRDDTPWYPSMRLFRQETPGDWAGVIERVRLALATAASRAVGAAPLPVGAAGI